MLGYVKYRQYRYVPTCINLPNLHNLQAPRIEV